MTTILPHHDPRPRRRLCWRPTATGCSTARCPSGSRVAWTRSTAASCSSRDRDGSLLDTDKAIWLQGRASWLLATLYSEVEPRPEWLQWSRHGIDFLRQYGFDSDGRMFFLVDRRGPAAAQAALHLQRDVHDRRVGGLRPCGRGCGGHRRGAGALSARPASSGHARRAGAEVEHRCAAHARAGCAR